VNSVKINYSFNNLILKSGEILVDIIELTPVAHVLLIETTKIWTDIYVTFMYEWSAKGPR
jgi:hypothetical protein